MRKYYYLLLLLGLLLPAISTQSQSESTLPNVIKHSKEIRKGKVKRMNPAKTRKAEVSPTTRKHVAQHSITRGYQPKKIYGYLVYDDEISDISLCSFNPNEPAAINLIDLGFEYYPSLACGAYGNGFYYYYGCDGDSNATFFASVDLSSNKLNIINDYELEDFFMPYDMTYDYSTNTMYAIVSMDYGDTMELAKIDLENGSIQSIAYLEDYYVALAATYEGTLYAISMEGTLYTIDKESGTPEYILDTNVYTDYICNQSMDFDHTDGSLYWNSYSYYEDSDIYESALFKINIEKGNIEPLGVVGNNAEICGLYIPFVRNSLEAPNLVTEIVLTPDTNGENSAILSWKNPETTLNEEALEELTKVEIYRDDISIKIFDASKNLEVGATMDFTDTNVPTGLHTYKIIASNSAGEGVESIVTGFIGHDVPEAVSDLLLTKVDEQTAKLTWSAPIKGVNGGWIDVTTLTYNIMRYPDEKLVADAYPSYEFTDRSLTSLKNYYYTVEAVTADGEGDIAKTDKILMGQALALPYETSFSMEDANQWTVLDANKDGSKWSFDTLLADYFFPDRKDGAYYFGSENEADDWLISSPTTITGNKSYKVYLDAQVDAKGNNATLEVTIGQSPDITTHKIVATYPISNFMLPETQTASIIGLEDGEYIIGVHLKTNGIGRLRITRFGVDRCIASQLSGVVTSEQQPLDGVLVQIKDKSGNTIIKTISDANGKYILPYIEQGEYTLTATAGGYENLEEELVIGEPEMMTINLEMTKATEANIKGTVKDEKGNPLSAVSIRLDGTLNYQTDTKANGTFEIQKVAVGEYILTVYKNSYEQRSSQIKITENQTLDAIALVRKVLAPSEVKVNNTIISWKEPIEHKTFRYDNGNPVTDYGPSGASYYNVIGSVYRQPAKLTEASWFTIDDGYDDHDYVNLFIFDLDANGEPTNSILYQEEGIKNNNGNWTSHTFGQTVNCPNGFVVALSVDGGYIALGATNETDEYPFIQATQCGNRDYQNESFYYIEEISPNRPIFMIRAKGIPTGAPLQQPVKQAKVNDNTTDSMYPLYNVYRLKEGEEEQMDNWTLMTQQPIAAFTFTDENWSNLAQGYYKYAVRAVYSENRLSEATLSEATGKEMKTNVTINMTTNVNGTSAQGASVRLSSSKNSYSGIADENGTVVLSNVEKDMYQLSVKHKGCEEYNQEMNYSTDATYTTNVIVSEKLINPHTLSITPEENDVYRLSWNEFSITDDFEEHPDFAINSPGSIGWNYIDGDGSVTQGFQDGTTGNWYEFENMFSPMAYIVFNPSAVEPSMESEFQAHSGKKFLLCLPGEGANDDYLISSELDGSDNFTFRFFALSYNGYDLMKVGYSFNGMETEDFIWTSGTVEVNTAKKWKEYSYNIPAGVRYVAVRCISTNLVAFMLDDICMTTDRATSQALAEGLGAHEYEIYLDGIKVTTQRNITYEFTNIPEGKHTAGVKAVYKSGTSELVTTEFEANGSSIQDLKNGHITLYPNPAKDYLYVEGEAKRIDIYNMNGVLTGSYDTPAQIAVNHLEDGIYTARIVTDKDLIMKKIIIKK